MRALILAIFFTVCCLVSASADPPENKPSNTGENALVQKLIAGLPKEGERAQDCLLELLELWSR